MIRRLAYVSGPRAGLPPSEIPKIVTASRINNARIGICGVLVYTGTDFAQLIEGVPEDVEGLWRRIRTDDRHVDVTLLLDEQDTVPWFPEWRMGYLADRALAARIAEWRTLQQGIEATERGMLRRLLAEADTM